MMQHPKGKLLILDLDETLVYATEKKLDQRANFSVGQYFVYERPFLNEFLKFCFENFEVAVWTTATRAYAEAILSKIISDGQKLNFLWTRERCTMAYDPEQQAHYYVKRMSKLRKRGYELKNIIVVDDTPEVWKSSYGNLVRVGKFVGGVNDDELRRLPAYLMTLLKIADVRVIDKRNWRRKI